MLQSSFSLRPLPFEMGDCRANPVLAGSSIRTARRAREFTPKNLQTGSRRRPWAKIAGEVSKERNVDVDARRFGHRTRLAGTHAAPRPHGLVRIPSHLARQYGRNLFARSL